MTKNFWYRIELDENGIITKRKRVARCGLGQNGSKTIVYVQATTQDEASDRIGEGFQGRVGVGRQLQFLHGDINCGLIEVLAEHVPNARFLFFSCPE